MAKTIASIIVSLVILGLLCGLGYHIYKNPMDLLTDVDLDDSSYDAGSDTSTLTCDVEIKNPNYLFGRLVTDFSYIISFKGSDGKTLDEVVVHPATAIENEDYEAELSFGPGGDYEAIKGKVSRAEIVIQSATFENTTRHRMAEGGKRFGSLLVAYVLYTICAIATFDLFVTVILPPYEPGMFRAIFRIVGCVAMIAVGCLAFLSGTMPIIVGLLA